MEIALLEKAKSLQLSPNEIPKQNSLSAEVSKLVLDPNSNLLSLVFYSQQTRPGQKLFIVYFIKNKIKYFKKHLGESFCEELFNEIATFLLEEMKIEHEDFLPEWPLQNQLKLVLAIRDVLEKVSEHVNDIFVIQMVQRALEIFELNFRRKWRVLGNLTSDVNQETNPLSPLQQISLQKMCILSEICLAKLQKQNQLILPSILKNEQMSILINLISKISGNKFLLDAVFCLMKRILRFSFKEDKANLREKAIERMKSFLKINEIFTLKEYFFRTKVSQPEDLLLKTHLLDLFARIISTHHKLDFIRQNEYLGIFKDGFTSSLNIINTRIQKQKQLLTDPEIKFLRSFIRLFQLIIKKNVPLDSQVFENRNNLINLFFFPLLSLDKNEHNYISENPKQFVLYGQDLVDKKSSRTLKCEVFLLFEIFCEKVDGFLVFMSEYLTKVILYTSYFVLFNDAQHSRLETIYKDPESNSFAQSLQNLFQSPKSHFENNLLKFLGEDDLTKFSFNSALILKQFYEERGKGNRNCAFRQFPDDIESESPDNRSTSTRVFGENAATFDEHRELDRHSRRRRIANDCGGGANDASSAVDREFAGSCAFVQLFHF